MQEHNYILFGIQGSGKGTQAQLLSQKIYIPHISTGDILREAIASDSEEGKKVKEFVERGDLVPDDILIPIFENRFMQDDCTKGFVLDGFPRTLNQAIKLDEMLLKHSRKITNAVLIDLDEEELFSRLSSRLTCRDCQAVYSTKVAPPSQPGICDTCGGELYQRVDDADRDSIKKRIASYHKLTGAAIDYYKESGKLIAVDGRLSIDEVHVRILEALGL